ncbi:MAG: hypothetical protein QF815_00830 [Candidatus Peribacteraceae bacterium]|jgi:hypothetical protein|nr:hypothetical protein [Candidatus Peribacteraceae bacterium]MDP7477330.1 hypothetical protein [Candidatus Peribacteraceae bacterium]
MEQDPVIVCNPSYGNGPYLRTTELALAVSAKIETPAKIVVPLLYGDTQKRIMQEEFGDQPKIILDEVYGEILKPIFFDGISFESFLQSWIETVDQVSADVQTHLESTYENPVMEIARAPLVQTGISPAYCTLFARLSEIWEQSIGIEEIDIDNQILKNAAIKMRELEDSYALRMICEPGTFEGENMIPPTATKHQLIDVQEPGIYVSVSGIAGGSEAIDTTHKIYTNAKPDETSPSCLGSNNILAQVARAGWGAIWKSLLTETPLFVMPYSNHDDPEIYFNIKKVQELGIGTLYGEQPIDTLLVDTSEMRQKLSTYKDSLEKKYGTLDGSSYAAQKIATLQL